MTLYQPGDEPSLYRHVNDLDISTMTYDELSDAFGSGSIEVYSIDPLTTTEIYTPSDTSISIEDVIIVNFDEPAPTSGISWARDEIGVKVTMTTRTMSGIFRKIVFTKVMMVESTHPSMRWFLTTNKTTIATFANMDNSGTSYSTK